MTYALTVMNATLLVRTPSPVWYQPSRSGSSADARAARSETRATIRRAAARAKRAIGGPLVSKRGAQRYRLGARRVHAVLVGSGDEKVPEGADATGKVLDEMRGIAETLALVKRAAR